MSNKELTKHRLKILVSLMPGTRNSEEMDFSALKDLESEGLLFLEGGKVWLTAKGLTVLSGLLPSLETILKEIRER